MSYVAQPAAKGEDADFHQCSNPEERRLAAPGSYVVPDLQDSGVHRCEVVIRRSRFIASMAHTPTSEAARLFTDRIRREFPDATHNCWAFAAGPAGDTNRVGYSDDGEPHGTAGRPMLTVLLHSGVGEVSVVATRYFGGIKLGTGGLVRAYQGLVRLGLETLPVREHMISASLDVVLEYAHLERLRRLLPDFRAQLVREHFGVDVTCRVRLPATSVSAFTSALTELTDGAVLVTLLET